MRHLTAFKDHVTNKLGKKRDTKPRSVQTQVHPDRRSGSPTSYLANETSPSQFQPENPPDLWQCAFSQMDHEEQNVLLKHYPALTNRDENDLRVIDAIDDVIDTTKKRYEEYQKEGGIRIRRSSGEDIDLRKVAGRIIDAAFSCKEVISSGVACDPTGHAAGAWAAVSLGLTMAQNHSDRRNACSNCSEYLAEVLARCGYIEMNFLPSQTSDRDMIRPAAIRVYMAILRYTVQVLTTQNFSPGKAIFDDITAAACQRLVEYRSSIEKEEQKLSQYITWDQYLRSEKNSQRILREIDESVAKSLKDLIAKFSLPIASEAFHNSFKDQYESLCLEGTRVQLLDQITQWARLPQGECIFWLNGMAGTGKSTIARTVAESSKEGGQLGASFFFKKGEPGRGNASLFISTIVKQLMAHSQQLTLAVLQAIDKDPDIALKALREQFEKLLLEPLQSVQSRSTTTMVIVIDALDECDSAEQIRTILEYLPRVQSPIGIRLKIFLTSRPDNPIVSWFQEHDTHQSMILHQISDTVVEDDISRFLQDRFAKIRKSKNISADWPGTGTIQELVKLSTPLFISAATVCLFIENERLNPVKRLEELLENQNKYVERMDKTYMPIMEQLLDGQHLDDRAQLLKQFRQTVGVIILLAAPLSVNALSVLIDSPEQTVESDLDCFRSVLNVPTERFSPVRILHLSFREFLLNTPSKFRVEEGKTHSEIAEHCLRTMNRKHNLKHDICNLRNYGILRADISPERIRQCLKPELQYSCRYWVYHLEQSKPLTVERERELLSFLQEHFLHWVEAMSLMGIVSETVKMIDKLGKLLLERQNNVDSAALKFIYDAKRFLLRIQHMTDIAPLQIYCSGLIFSPTASVVRELFLEKERPKTICTLPQVDMYWNSNKQTLEGHSSRVWSVAFSPDGQTVASGSYDNTIKLWDAQTGKELQTLQGHSSSVWSVAFSPDGQTVASGSYNKTIKLWDTQTGKELQTLQGHSGSVWSVAFSPDGQTVASGSFDNTIKLWDAQTGKELQTLQGHSDSVQSVAFSPDGQTVASGSSDNTIKLWDAQTGEELQTLQGHSGSVQSVAFSPDGQTVASGSSDSTIKLWDTQTGKELQTLQGHSSSVWSVAFSPDSQTVASGSSDNTIKLWDAQTGKELQTLQGHSRSVQSVAFSPDGQTVASGSSDNMIKLWDAQTGKELQTLQGHSRSVRSVAFSPDGQTVASDSSDSTIKLWDAQTGKELQTLQGHSNSIQSVAFSPDGQTVASGSSDNMIKLWDAQTGKELQTLQGHSRSVRSVAFSPDGQTVASGSSDSTIKLWDAQTGKELQTLQGHSDYVLSVAFSPDGQTVASDSSDSTIKLWDAQTGKELQTLEGRPDSVASIAGQILSQSNPHVSVGNDWVTFETENLIWLPAEYRHFICSDIKHDRLALGYFTGNVLIIGFRND